MKRIIPKHPLIIRWNHWLNFPVLGIMIWSGLLIYWANDVYRLGFGDKTLIKFFPNSFYDLLHIPYHLASGMAFHFAFMWLFFLNGLIYLFYTVFSGEWRYLVPGRGTLKNAWFVLLHDLHLRIEKPPQAKYNAAQQIAYTAIILMGMGSLLTGLAIYKPVQFNWLCWLLGGYAAARVEHFILTLGYAAFFLVHIAQVIRAGWNNFQAIVTGFGVERSIVLPNAVSEEKILPSISASGTDIVEKNKKFDSKTTDSENSDLHLENKENPNPEGVT